MKEESKDPITALGHLALALTIISAVLAVLLALWLVWLYMHGV